ncbi:MAG: sulfatase [Pirellulales bacterium]
MISRTSQLVMLRITWLLAPSLVAFAILPLAAAEKLNVVLIAVDDMNTDIGCYGHPLVKTPAIDRVAQRGVRFEHAYCQYPVCNPSRVSMLSGLRPDTTGVLDLQTPPRTVVGNAVFLPQHFRNLGYYTAHIGKIYHTGDAMEDPASWDFEAREWGKHPPAETVIRQQRIERPRNYHVEWHELRSTDAETADGVVARQASAMLDQLKGRGRPFFLAVGFRRPHAPYAAPKKYFDSYPPDKIPPLVEPAEHLPKIPVAALTYPQGTPLLSTRQRAENVAAYWACITFVDAQIAHLLEALDRNDLWRNTVVVFYSDHGYHLGEHGGMWHKMSLFEESARVPLVIVAPGAAGAGQSCERIVELVDVYPTLVELCGLPTVSGLQGASLAPLLRNPAAEWQRPAFTQVVHEEAVGRSVRTPRWRYTEWNGGRQGAELYDHDTDPREYVNLANDPEWATLRAGLRALLPAENATLKRAESEAPASRPASN